MVVIAACTRKLPLLHIFRLQLVSAVEKKKKKRQECSSGMIECPYQEIHELIRQLNVRCQSVIGPMGKSMRRDKIDPKYSICTRLYHHVPRPSIIVEHIGVVDLALFLKAA